MADRDNSAAAAVTAVTIAAKRKRVTLTQLPTHPDAAVHDDEPVSKRHHLLPAASAYPCEYTPYASDVYSHARSMELEPTRRPNADYMAAVQVDVLPRMRAILIDWLVQVADYYGLVSDTLHRTVAYVDCFLSNRALISRQRLQLLGVSAMLLASKVEEISPPKVEYLCYTTDYTYTRQELFNMECDILTALRFEMGTPTARTFLRKFMRCAQQDNNKYASLQMEFLGRYLCDLSLLDYSLLGFLPSLVAASVLFVARLSLDPYSHPWSKKMQALTGYEPSELKECVNAIHQMQLNRKYPDMEAIREKYKQPRFKGVSDLLPRVEIPASYFRKLKD